MIVLGKLNYCLENSSKGGVRKKAISDCCVFCLKVHEHLVSADPNFEDKKPNLYFAEISKLKQRTDVGVVNGLHKYDTLSRRKKIIWQRFVLFLSKEACYNFVNI